MSDAQTLAVYAAKAADYAKIVTRHRPDHDLSAFIDLIPTGGTVLDWGCGTGNSAAMMAEAGLRVTATDASPDMVALAHDQYGINARCALFDDLDAVDTFDGVYANFSLLHAPRADMPRHLAQAARALKPGGILHLGLKTGRGAGRDALGRYYTYYTLDALTLLLQQAGLDPIRHRTGETRGLAGTTDPFVIMIARNPDA